MSTELIKVKVEGDQQLVMARDLYKGLGLKGRFSRWVDNNFDLFTEDQDFYRCTTSTVVNNGGHLPLVDYLLTIDMAKQLAMMARTEKSKQYREYFITLEKNGIVLRKSSNGVMQFCRVKILSSKLKTKN